MKIIPISDNTNVNNELPEFDRELIASLPSSDPHYASYPTADCFHKGFKETEYIQALNLRSMGTLDKPLSLYIRVLSCNTICYYCGCNKIITKDESRAGVYIRYLERGVELLAPHLGGRHQLTRLHFGGDMSTFLSDDQLERVFDMIRKYFQLIPNGKYSIEIDPRKVSHEAVLKLGKPGFNRISVDIQDFDPRTQAAVNHIQSYKETKEIVDAACEARFKFVSVGLIYSLPHQSTESAKATIDTALSLSPDHLAFYHYAHPPHIFRPQRRTDTNVVPGSKEKLDMLQYCVQTLTERGYVFIGMDHFAEPDDEFSIVLKEGSLQRNFQGYSTYIDYDLVTIDMSSIGKIGNTYFQNKHDIDTYYAAPGAGHLPVVRGYQLNQDDISRRDIIQDLVCHFSLDYRIYESVLGVPLNRYFAVELKDTKQLETLGLVRLRLHSLTVTPKGRFLIRNIAMVFDYHPHHRKTKARYSQTI